MKIQHKILVGIATIMHILFFIAWVSTFYINDLPNKFLILIPPSLNPPLMAYVISFTFLALYNLLVLFLEIIYIIHLMDNINIEKRHKTRWVIYFLLASILSMPAYWYLYLWKDKS
jgi:hypothetical protein